MTGWVVALTVGLAAAMFGWLRAVLRERHTSQLMRSAADIARAAAQSQITRAREQASANQADADTRAAQEVSHAVADHSLSDHLRGLNRAAAAELTAMAEEPTKPGGSPVR